MNFTQDIPGNNSYITNRVESLGALANLSNLTVDLLEIRIFSEGYFEIKFYGFR